MRQNFPLALAYVLHHEGGFVNDPRDPGGATNKGVTQAVYDKWRASHSLPRQSVALIAPVEVEAIYLNLYWLPLRSDDLPSGVDYCAFDYAVNSGDHQAASEVEHAARDLQAAVAVQIDGDIGPITLSAIARCDPKAVIEDICADRLVFLRHLKTFPIFGAGWTARVHEVQAQAEAMLA